MSDVILHCFRIMSLFIAHQVRLWHNSVEHTFPSQFIQFGGNFIVKVSDKNPINLTNSTGRIEAKTTSHKYADWIIWQCTMANKLNAVLQMNA